MRIHQLVFFLSGAASLVYQVVWLRLAGRALGSDALGAALVLTGFMGGMAFGAWLLAWPPAAGRLERARSAERLYALLLVGVAVCAALSPLGFQAIEGLQAFALRAAALLALLLPPTLAMGATFPLMGRLVVRGAHAAGEQTADFYGANTAGAAAGALLAPFVLLQALGLNGALLAGGVMDLAAAALAWGALRAAAGPLAVLPEEPALRQGAEPEPAPRLPWGLAVALLGAAALGLEVLLTRVLIGLLGGSVYAYGILLGVYLAGLAFGARQARLALGRGIAPARLFRWAALAAGPLALAGVLLLDWRIGAGSPLHGLRNMSTRDGGALWAARVMLAGLALLPPTVAFGAALPAAIGAAARSSGERSVTRVLGGLYAANTAGAALGAVVTGLLLGRIGLGASLAWICALPLGVGLLARAPAPRALERSAGGLAAGLGLLLGWLTLRPPVDDGALLAEYHSAVSTAGVEERPSADPLGAPLRVLRVNGKVVAGSAPIDRRLQALLGALPRLLHGSPERALVVGLGTGMTAASLLPAESLVSLEVVELSTAIPRAAVWFEPWLDGLFDDPRLTLRVADGRPFIARSADSWDLITCDPIHPWTRGSSDLYALEHFQAIAEHLEPGGIASQWLPLYQLSTADVDVVLAGWLAAFPRCAAYLTGYDLVLIGRHTGSVDLFELLDSEDPLRRELDPQSAVRLAEIGIHSLAQLAALEVADDAALRARASGVEPMRLARPVLEFRAPKSFLGGVSGEVLRWCIDARRAPVLPAALAPLAERQAAALTEFLDASQEQDWQVRAAAYGRRLLEPDPLPADRVEDPPAAGSDPPGTASEGL